MAIVDLASYTSIYTALFVRMEIAGYATLRYSTHFANYTIRESDGVDYVYSNLGTLVGVSDNTFGIRTNPEEVTITISGIPLTNVSDVLGNNVKGSKVEIRRQFFRGNNYAVIGSPLIKFKGVVNNYNIVEDFPTDGSGLGTCTIGFICSTLIDLMENKTAGRRTNPLDQKLYFPNDLSMDRVPTIAGSSFNFGLPR
jgi:hypothetical protein